jgi:poly-gamma-glutamate synthesis protein (capsule biosynthesis protein)
MTQAARALRRCALAALAFAIPLALVATPDAALAQSKEQPAKKKREKGEKAAKTERPAPSPAPVTFKAECVDPTKTLTLAAVGDVLLHDMFQKWAAGQPEGFYASMKPVEPIIKAADVAIANLEGPAAEGVASNGKPTKPPATRYDRSVYRGYPMFNYHPSIVTDLKKIGFDVLQTANNHSLDRHQLGADKTIEAIKAAGLAFTGTRHTGAMDAPWHAEVTANAAGGSYKLAFLACTYGTNGIPDRAKQVLHCYDQKDEVLDVVKKLAARPDIHAVFLTPHWGNEYQHKADPKQIGLAKEAIDAGATGVIGAHPHVIQPIEKVMAADGREGFVAYSLGNFVSNQIGLPRLSSAILLLGLTPGANGKLVPNAVGWVPLRMFVRGRFSIDAIDRLAGGDGKDSRAHLVRHLPEKNIHPPAAPFWKHVACKSS